jgi:hypothetical protein
MFAQGCLASFLVGDRALCDSPLWSTEHRSHVSSRVRPEVVSPLIAASPSALDGVEASRLPHSGRSFRWKTYIHARVAQARACAPRRSRV